MSWSLDRIEENLAVLIGDDEKQIIVPIDQLPAGVKAGDCFTVSDGQYVYDPQETENRRNRISYLEQLLRSKK